MNNEQNCYTIRDAKAEAYLTPFFQVNDAVAIRMLTAAANDPNHQFFTNAEDFTLWRIGSFDQMTGEVTPEVGVLVAKVYDLKDHSRPLEVVENKEVN